MLVIEIFFIVLYVVNCIYVSKKRRELFNLPSFSYIFWKYTLFVFRYTIKITSSSSNKFTLNYTLVQIKKQTNKLVNIRNDFRNKEPRFSSIFALICLSRKWLIMFLFLKKLWTFCVLWVILKFQNNTENVMRSRKKGNSCENNLLKTKLF